MVSRMNPILTAFAILLPLSALADAPSPLGPNGGKFGDWTAATYGKGADKACYAFTAAQIRTWIKKRGAVLLTVTERRGAHDEVTLGAGYTYPANAKVTLKIDDKSVDFYTQGAAFTSDGAGTVAAFKNGSAVPRRSTGPLATPSRMISRSPVSPRAYSAITKACP